jgi:hypothetical protein
MVILSVKDVLQPRHYFWFPLLLVLGMATGCTDRQPVPDVVTFNRHVRPILSDNCFKCHGPDAGSREGELRLDIEAEAKEDRDGYQVIAPGKPKQSELIRRILLDETDKDHMPHQDANKALTAYEIAVLNKWVEQGAAYEPHWAYISPKRPPLPSANAVQDVAHPIDLFVVAKLAEVGQNLSAEADRVTLLRRISFDLIGLPPTQEEVDVFLQDTRPEAYEVVVDRLLASPHFGERMAISWLDVVRYADTNGYHTDVHRNIYPYRDYVIEAFNTNKPFDQFTREQLAGDLLPEATLEQQIASGFNRLNQITKEGGAQAPEYLVKYAADRVRAVGATWMGATIGCAECHDHKFDPYTSKDFYQCTCSRIEF